jgi:hypothetical protein
MRRKALLAAARADRRSRAISVQELLQFCPTRSPVSNLLDTGWLGRQFVLAKLIRAMARLDSKSWSCCCGFSETAAIDPRDVADQAPADFIFANAHGTAEQRNPEQRIAMDFVARYAASENRFAASVDGRSEKRLVAIRRPHLGARRARRIRAVRP